MLGLTFAVPIGLLFLLAPRALLGIFGMEDPGVLELGRQLLVYLSLSGVFLTVALSYTGGLQGTGDTRSPFFISLVSQVILPLGICAVLDAVRGLQPADIWFAIVLGHFARCALSIGRFGEWDSGMVYGGNTLLVVEQDASLTLELTQRVYIMEHGKIGLEGKSDELMDNEEVKRVYFQLG